MVVNRALAKAFQSAAFQTAVEQAVHKCVTKPQIVDAVATRTIFAHIFTVPVAKCFKQEIEKRSLEKATI